MIIASTITTYTKRDVLGQELSRALTEIQDELGGRVISVDKATAEYSKEAYIVIWDDNKDRTRHGDEIVTAISKDGTERVVDLSGEFNVNEYKYRNQAEWITTRTLQHDGEFYCSACDNDSPENKKWKYCPNCGSRMKGVE